VATRQGAEVLRRLSRLAADGHDDEGFRAAADEEVLRPVLGFSVAAWSTADPATGLLTSCHLFGLPYDAARERTVFYCEYEVDGDGGARYADLARAERPVAALGLTSGGQPASTLRHRLILGPLGAVDDLRVALVSGGLLWGSLTAYRMAGASPFGEEDLRLAAAAAPVLATGIRRGLLQRASVSPVAATAVPDPPGALVVDGGGAVVLTTGAAERWLDQIDQSGHLPTAMTALAAALRSGLGPEDLEATLVGRDGGQVAVHASRAKGSDDDSVAFVLGRPRPPTLAEHVAAAHELTGRERDVAALALRGLSNKEMAAALGTSAFTVNDQLKSIFAKVGVTSRGQLAARLLALHHLPRVRAGVAPGPYGWFLEDGTRGR
jgi:DNA-binding CsgD family transcriptional regulator